MVSVGRDLKDLALVRLMREGQKWCVGFPCFGLHFCGTDLFEKMACV